MSMLGFVGGIIVVLVLKFLLRGMIIDKFAELIGGGDGGNKWVSGIIHFLAPGLIALLILIVSSQVDKFCPQLAVFLVVVAVIIGGVLGLGFVVLSGYLPFIGAVLAPAVSQIMAVFWILLIIAIVEFIISIVLPGIGTIISMILSVIVVIVISGYAGGLFNIATCIESSGTAGWFGENANAIIRKVFGFYIGVPKPF